VVRHLWDRVTPLADLLLAAVVLVVALQPLFRDKAGDVPAWGYVLVIAQCVPLVFRRRLPFTVAGVCGALTVVYGMSSLPDPPVPYAGLLSLYSVAAHGTRDRANAAGVVAVFALVGSLAFDPAADAEDVTVQTLLFTTAWLLGDSTRRRRERTVALEERAAQLERARTAEAAAAVAAERNRIARELHDMVAHHLSMMVVQAEAGAVAASNRPDRVVPSFDAISTTGKQALREMRRLLGVLKEDGTASTAPQPGIEDIDELVGGVRSAGLDVRLRVNGEPYEVPSAVGLSAYRIVQEALTNCIRHAKARRADVELSYDAGVLRISVVDDGTGGEAGPGGHGLIAMRERVSLVGGTLETGPGPDGGWSVRATLPMNPPSPEEDA
jgi:signal transduction histidine kinase